MSLLLGMIYGCSSSAEFARQNVARELLAQRQAQRTAWDLYQKGAKAMEANQLDQARALLTHATTLDSRNLAAWLCLGMVEYKTGNYFAAATAYDRAIRVAPSRYEPHFDLALVFQTVGQYGKAAAEFETAMRIGGERTEVLEELARCYIQMNQKLERARELVDRAAEQELRPEWQNWLSRQSLRLGILLSQSRRDKSSTSPATTTATKGAPSSP